MTISSLSNFTVLIKKIARKGSLRRKITTKKQRSRSYHHTTITLDQDLASVSSCSTIEDEKHQDMTSKINKSDKTNSLVTTTTISLVKNDDDDDNNDTVESTTETTTMKDMPTITTNNDHEKGTHSDNETIVRDFAYPESSPLHYGQVNNESQISLSSSRFNGCQAKALYDFIPETDHEIGMKRGQVIWIQYRQCAGWLIADVDDDTGMVPESYVEFL